MATLAFIPYVPKVLNPKSTYKLPPKDTSKHFRPFHSSQHMTTQENDSLSQNVDGDGRAIVREAFTEVVNISTNSIEDADDTYFPTVKELVSSFRKDGLPQQGWSEKPAPQTVDELAMEKSGHFSNLDKSTLGGNMDGSQDMPIVLDDVESDDAASKVDLSDFRADSIYQDVDSFSLEASSKATTLFSPSRPCHDSNSITSGPAKHSETNVETETTEAENGYRPLKRKAGKTRRHNQSDPSVILDSSTECDSESDIDYKPRQKKQRADHAAQSELAKPKAIAEVDSKQEWEIHGIIGMEDIDGIPHFWVDWKPTLVPKYHLKNAKALVNKYKAKLNRTQLKKERGRSRKQK